MATRKRPTPTPPPEPPGSDATLHLFLGGLGGMPVVSASVGLISGSETTWLRVEFNDMPKSRPRHSGHFTVSGSPADVRALVESLGWALDHPEAMQP